MDLSTPFSSYTSSVPGPWPKSCSDSSPLEGSPTSRLTFGTYHGPDARAVVAEVGPSWDQGSLKHVRDSISETPPDGWPTSRTIPVDHEPAIRPPTAEPEFLALIPRDLVRPYQNRNFPNRWCTLLHHNRCTLVP